MTARDRPPCSMTPQSASGFRKAIQDQRHLLNAGDVILNENILVGRVGIRRWMPRSLRTCIDAEGGAELIPGTRALRRRCQNRFLSSQFFPAFGDDFGERRIEWSSARRL